MAKRLQTPGLKRPWVRATTWVLGVVLVAAAVWFAAQGVDLSAVRSVSAVTLGVMAFAVAGNVLLSAALFGSVTKVFPLDRPVRYATMLALIAGSALLNYLPAVRAGLFGRAAYLKKRHGLALRHSGATLVYVMVVTALVFAAVAAPLAIARVAAPGYERIPWFSWAVAAAAVLWLSVGLRFAWDARGARQWSWAPLRAADLLVASARLWLAFAALGSPIGFAEAVVMSAASLVVKLIGLTPNGLGLSEWAVAALSAVLTPVETGVAAAAAVLDRAVEVAVVVPAGLVGLAWLRRESKSQAETVAVG